MKVGKILGKMCLGLGYTGLAAYGAMSLTALYETVKEKVAERRRKHWKKGYDDCYKELSIEMDRLRSENARLYKEALKRTEAAE
jgi:hypothetical protein